MNIVSQIVRFHQRVFHMLLKNGADEYDAIHSLNPLSRILSHNPAFQSVK